MYGRSLNMGLGVGTLLEITILDFICTVFHRYNTIYTVFQRYNTQTHN